MLFLASRIHFDIEPADAFPQIMLMPASREELRTVPNAIPWKPIAATVNGRAITRGELDRLLAPERARLRATYPRGGEVYREKLSEAQRMILERLIEAELILKQSSATSGGWRRQGVASPRGLPAALQPCTLQTDAPRRSAHAGRPPPRPASGWVKYAHPHHVSHPSIPSFRDRG